MERGVTALVRILIVAVLLGLLVIIFHPAYRGTARAMLRSRVEESPIWKSNADYYREVSYDDGGAYEDPE